MNLFSLNDNKVEISPEVKLLEDFSPLFEKELAYVYFTQDYKSPYNQYPEDVRSAKVMEDINLKEITEQTRRACKKYVELQETVSMRLLKSARGAILKLADFFEREGPKSKNYTKNLESLGKLIESIDRLEEKVRKEVSLEGKSKAGREINFFEE
jgi:hypothetical protein